MVSDKLIIAMDGVANVKVRVGVWEEQWIRFSSRFTMSFLGLDHPEQGQQQGHVDELTRKE